LEVVLPNCIRKILCGIPCIKILGPPPLEQSRKHSARSLYKMITFRGVTKLESPFDKALISILTAWLVSHTLKQNFDHLLTFTGGDI
jgi:hypothetical protein